MTGNDMTDDELLKMAGEAMPEKTRAQGKIVRRPASTDVSFQEKASPAADDPHLLADLQALLKIKLPPPPCSSGCADVAYQYERGDGQRATTVVQIRDGKVVRKIRRG